MAGQTLTGEKKLNGLLFQKSLETLKSQAPLLASYIQADLQSINYTRAYLDSVELDGEGDLMAQASFDRHKATGVTFDNPSPELEGFTKRFYADLNEGKPPAFSDEEIIVANAGIKSENIEPGLEKYASFDVLASFDLPQDTNLASALKNHFGEKAASVAKEEPLHPSLPQDYALAVALPAYAEKMRDRKDAYEKILTADTEVPQAIELAIALENYIDKKAADTTMQEFAENSVMVTAGLSMPRAVPSVESEIVISLPKDTPVTVSDLAPLPEKIAAIPESRVHVADLEPAKPNPVNDWLGIKSEIKLSNSFVEARDLPALPKKPELVTAEVDFGDSLSKLVREQYGKALKGQNMNDIYAAIANMPENKEQFETNAERANKDFDEYALYPGNKIILPKFLSDLNILEPEAEVAKTAPIPLPRLNREHVLGQ